MAGVHFDGTIVDAMTTTMTMSRFCAVVLALSIAHAVAQNCSICPDASAVNGSVVVPLGNVSCGALEAIAQSANETTCSGILQPNAAWCGCPGVAPTCTLCENGSSPLYFDVTPDGTDLTCRQLEYLATMAPDDQACSDMGNFADVCGCSAASSGSFCTLCPDGNPPPNFDLELPNGATCGSVDTFARQTTTSHQCTVLQSYAAASCGCEGSTNSTADFCTTLCPDGMPVPDPNVIAGVSVSGVKTCGDLQSQAALGVQDPTKCNVQALLGVYACGCENTLPFLSCNLCEDGSVASNLLHDVDGVGNTCVEFMAFVQDETDPFKCMAVQATAGRYCGCANPVASENACRICGDDNLLPDPSRMAAPQDKSCAEVEYIANLDEGRMCTMIQADFAETCCEPQQSNPMEVTDNLPYADDVYVEATAPPAYLPGAYNYNGGDISSSVREVRHMTMLFTFIAVAAFVVV